MKARRRGPNPSHIGFRPTPELREQWETWLETQPPVLRSRFLNAALSFYLELAARHGIDSITLRPKLPKSKK